MDKAQKTIQKLFKKHRQLVLYGLIGGMGALIDLVVFLFLFNVLSVNPILANIISVSLGITNNFFLNVKFNFKVKNDLLHRFLLFYGAGIFGLLLSIALLYIFSSQLGASANLVKVLSIPVIVLLQYIFNSKVSLNDSKNKQLPKLRLQAKHLLIGALLVLLYLIFVKHATYFGFSDEYDNILGGYLISHHGTALYSQLFSHHMPLPYFVGAVITFFTDTDLNRFRIVFLTGMFIWLLFITKRLNKTVGTPLALLFLALVGLTQYTTWTHMLLAETFIAYALVHATLLLIFDLWSSKRQPTIKDAVTIGILGAVITLSSLSYLFMALLIYLVFAVIAVRAIMGQRREAIAKHLAAMAAVLAAPYVLLLGYLVANHALSAFLHDAYRFNQLYYSKFTNDVSGSVVQTLHNNFLVWLADAAHVFGLGPVGQSVPLVTVLLFIFAIVFIASFFALRQYLVGSFLLGVLYFSSSRSGTLTSFLQPNGNNRISAVYITLLLLWLVIAIHRMLRTKTVGERTAAQSLIGVAGILAIIITVALGLQSQALNDQIATAERSQIETGLTLNKNGGPEAAVINQVASPSDYYWVGPFDFYTQIFIHAKRASDFTFFAPWQGICGECHQQILADFKAEQPKVIYYEPHLHIFGLDTNDYFKSELKYINQNYYHYSTPRLKNYYFLKQDRPAIDAKLKTGDYL